MYTKMFTLILVACLCLVSGAMAQTLTNADVVKLVKAGVGEGIVISTLQSKPANFDTSVDAIVALKEAGVSDKVIAAMLEKNSPAAPRTAQEANREVLPTSPAGMIKIPEGTELALLTVEDLSSATAQEGDVVKLEVAEDVVIDGVVVISKGSPQTGRVTLATKGKMFNQPANLVFLTEYVAAVDGTKVRVRAYKDKNGVDMSLRRMVDPTKFFRKGKNVEFPKGTTMRVTVDADKEIKRPTALTAAAK